jgi:hypothetical protein
LKASKIRFFIFGIKAKFDPNLHWLEERYKPLLDHIIEKPVEEAQGLIIDYVAGDRIGLPKTYYDYVKTKLGIAEKIGLTPSPTQKFHVSRSHREAEDQKQRRIVTP